MTMSKEILGVLVDLVENKLSCMQISDREDMREVMMLQQCLNQLNGGAGFTQGMLDSAEQMPKRGRRRKSGMQSAGGMAR